MVFFRLWKEIGRRRENVNEEKKEEWSQQTEEISNQENSISPEETTSEEAKKTEEKQKPTSKKIINGIGELLLYVVIALICLFVIPKYVVQRTEVSGPSMEATLQDKDSIMVEKVSYRFGKPNRFDIIVFYHFFDNNYQNKKDEGAYDLYVKRIIGLPGETVQIVGQTILINGEPLEENYGKDPIAFEGVAEEPIVLGEDEYFVLGDNREVSQDSRYEEVGNIKEDLIVGRAWIRVYPFNKIGFLTVNH